MSPPLLRSQTNSPTPLPPQALFYDLKSIIVNAEKPSYVERLGVAPDIGFLVAKSLIADPDVERRCVRIGFHPISRRLSITMPTLAHDSIHAWATGEYGKARRSDFFTQAECDDLDFLSDAGFDNFLPPWQYAVKQPDMSFLPVAARRLPTVVVETSYTEPWTKLVDDANLWLLGGSPDVNAVLLVKFSKLSNNRVKGYLELRRSHGPNSPRMQIFPAPEAGAVQRLTWTREDFYPQGGVPTGRDPRDTWTWDLDDLRRRAARLITRLGLTPA